MNTPKEMAKIVFNALDDKKAEDIKVIEVTDITVLADYFIIANGTNSSQVSALVDSVEEALAKEGHQPKRIEGIGTTNWVLMDYGDIVIHIFSREDRLFYDLERIWRDGRTIDKNDL